MQCNGYIQSLAEGWIYYSSQTIYSSYPFCSFGVILLTSVTHELYARNHQFIHSIVITQPFKLTTNNLIHSINILAWFLINDIIRMFDCSLCTHEFFPQIQCQQSTLLRLTSHLLCGDRVWLIQFTSTTTHINSPACDFGVWIAC